jgi:hypothetical protein
MSVWVFEIVFPVHQKVAEGIIEKTVPDDHIYHLIIIFSYFVNEFRTSFMSYAYPRIPFFFIPYKFRVGVIVAACFDNLNIKTGYFFILLSDKTKNSK